MDINELYSIGAVARRTGLSVSAVRYYADAGIVEATGSTAGGNRLYDVRAIARLELVRTLRELDAGLDEIRRVLAGEATLGELAETHLALVEQQEGRLRARRAVLRTMVRQQSTAEQVTLMHRLVGLSDEERDRIMEDFWAEVGAGIVVPDKLIDWWRQSRPQLPEQPSVGQLEAWIELADLVGDRAVRLAVRRELEEVCSTDGGQIMSSPAMLDAFEEAGPIGEAAMAAAREGEPADSPRARKIADQWAEWLLALLGGAPDSPQFRRESGDNMLAAEQMEREAQAEAGDSPLDRYQALVTTINGPPEQFPYAWLAAALHASA
ncbi:MerR family transcriptional regulator [Actinoplanes sp. G11-F43]|uniref:MerR family transcriptional regulator n=1 Tax=Actinoplanes sp. G11-F43 TaxID=3424130 RepID=UPI003D348AEE